MQAGRKVMRCDSDVGVNAGRWRFISSSSPVSACLSRAMAIKPGLTEFCETVKVPEAGRALAKFSLYSDPQFW